MQWRSARSRWRSRRSRRREVVRARRRGDRGTVAASSTVNGGERARAEGNEGEREVDLAGGGAEAEGRAGASRREARGGGGAGAIILPVAGEGVRRGRPLFDPGRGNREGGEGESGLGRGSGVAAQFGPGCSGGTGLLLFFLFCSVLFSVFLLFVYFLFCYISFKVFRHFIKRSFLHHNCQCII